MNRERSVDKQYWRSSNTEKHIKEILTRPSLLAHQAAHLQVSRNRGVGLRYPSEPRLRMFKSSTRLSALVSNLAMEYRYEVDARETTTSPRSSESEMVPSDSSKCLESRGRPTLDQRTMGDTFCLLFECVVRSCIRDPSAAQYIDRIAFASSCTALSCRKDVYARGKSGMTIKSK